MYFYGLGEKTGHLNKKSYHYVNWNTDNPSPHGETFDRLYKSIPFLISIKDTTAFGIFFDNHFKTYFDMGRDNKDILNLREQFHFLNFGLLDISNADGHMKMRKDLWK